MSIADLRTKLAASEEVTATGGGPPKWDPRPGDVLCGPVVKRYVRESSEKYRRDDDDRTYVDLIVHDEDADCDEDGNVLLRCTPSALKRFVREEAISVGDLVALEFVTKRSTSGGNNANVYKLAVQHGEEPTSPGDPNPFLDGGKANA